MVVMQSQRTNPFEAAARATKTAAIVAIVYEMAGGPLSDAQLALVKSWTPVEWCGLVAGYNLRTGARINAPSSETIDLVLDTLDRARGLRGGGMSSVMRTTRWHDPGSRSLPFGDGALVIGRISYDHDHTLRPLRAGYWDERDCCLRGADGNPVHGLGNLVEVGVPS